jgi:hypothetical protein
LERGEIFFKIKPYTYKSRVKASTFAIGKKLRIAAKRGAEPIPMEASKLF